VCVCVCACVRVCVCVCHVHDQWKQPDIEPDIDCVLCPVGETLTHSQVMLNVTGSRSGAYIPHINYDDDSSVCVYVWHRSEEGHLKESIMNFNLRTNICISSAHCFAQADKITDKRHKVLKTVRRAHPVHI